MPLKSLEMSGNQAAPPFPAGLPEQQHLHQMCCLCFDAVAARLSVHDAAVAQTSFGGSRFPLFVTWKTRDGDGDSLRGCIGNFSELDLDSGLKEYALVAAFKDRRFHPIQAHELQSLSCGVSLLVQFEEVEHYLDWEVGVHGIWIEFHAPELGGKKTATYLPEVAKEQGWTHIEALNSLLRKGGYKKAVTEEFRCSVKVTRYQSLKHTITYEDYLTWREGP